MIDIPVGAVMKHPIQTFRHDMLVVEAAQELYDHNCGSLIITEGTEDIPVEIVTKSDINMVVAEGKTPTEITVEEIMSRPLISVTTTDTIQTAAERMQNYSVKKLPVTDESGTLVGMLTASDLAYYLPTFVKKIHSHRPVHRTEKSGP